VPVRAIELTARPTKTQPGFKDLGDFNSLAFIKNNAQETSCDNNFKPSLSAAEFS